MSELWRLSASEVAHLVRTRKVSAREVADAALQRLDSVNPRIQAIVDCRPNLVREQADRVDSALAHGNDPGPLAGVPVTVKINIDQAGFATTDGSRLQETLVAKCNSPVVDNLVRTGAVLLGRSNAPTFALRWFTSNLLYGGTHTRNPRPRVRAGPGRPAGPGGPAGPAGPRGATRHEVLCASGLHAAFEPDYSALAARAAGRAFAHERPLARSCCRRCSAHECASTSQRTDRTLNIPEGAPAKRAIAAPDSVRQ